MIRLRPLLAAALIAAGALASPARGVEPDEILTDPALEQRARDIGRNLRCLVCQNQSIDESQAELARDLRLLVRERLRAGDSDAQVVDFVVARYGDFVLLKPPLRKETLPLWLGPFALGLIGLAGVALYFARRRKTVPPPAPLSQAERRRLEALLENDGAP